MPKGKEAAGAFRVGDEVQARCYAHGFRGYWPAVVVEVIPPPKWPVQQAETEAQFVVKWAQGPKCSVLRVSDARGSTSVSQHVFSGCRVEGQRIGDSVFFSGCRSSG